jgi:hypothetical protein
MDSGIRGAGAVKLELNAVNDVKSEILIKKRQCRMIKFLQLRFLFFKNLRQI